jgi:hypothetical protein
LIAMVSELVLQQQSTLLNKSVRVHPKQAKSLTALTAPGAHTVVAAAAVVRMSAKMRLPWVAIHKEVALASWEVEVVSNQNYDTKASQITRWSYCTLKPVRAHHAL